MQAFTFKSHYSNLHIDFQFKILVLRGTAGGPASQVNQGEIGVYDSMFFSYNLLPGQWGASEYYASGLG